MSTRMNRLVIAKRLYFIFVFGLLILLSNSPARSQSLESCTAKYFSPGDISWRNATGLAFDAQDNLSGRSNVDGGFNLTSIAVRTLQG